MPEETAVMETVDSSAGVVESSDSSSSQQEIPLEESKQSTPDQKLDRRTNPDALRKALKFLRENGGEHSQRAQDLERMLGETKSYKTAFQTVREAREARQALDALGGREKLAEIQQYTARMQEVDAMLEAGDKRVLPIILETGTTGLVKLLPDILTELQKADGNSVAAALKPHAFSYLQSQQVPSLIDGMVMAFNANKPEEAKEYLARLVDWYKKESGGTQQQADPARQALETEREQFHQQRFEAEVKSAFEPMISHAEGAIDKELAPYQKQYGFSGDLLDVIRNDVWKRIERERNADPLFQSMIGTKVNERTRKVDPSTSEFLKQQTTQRVKDATRKEIELRYGFMKKPAATPEVKKDVVAAPAIAGLTPDYEVMRSKWGRSATQDAILQGKALNAQGKPIVKVGKVWKLA